MFEKEFEKLRQLEEELDAMKKLNADQDIQNDQKRKIWKQEKKICELFDKELKEMGKR